MFYVKLMKRKEMREKYQHYMQQYLSSFYFRSYIDVKKNRKKKTI